LLTLRSFIFVCTVVVVPIYIIIFYTDNTSLVFSILTCQSLLNLNALCSLIKTYVIPHSSVDSPVIHSGLRRKVFSSEAFNNPYDTRPLDSCPSTWTQKAYPEQHVIRHAHPPACHTSHPKSTDVWRVKKRCEPRPSASQFFVRWAVVLTASPLAQVRALVRCLLLRHFFSFV